MQNRSGKEEVVMSIELTVGRKEREKTEKKKRSPDRLNLGYGEEEEGFFAAGHRTFHRYFRHSTHKIPVIVLFRFILSITNVLR